jgi:two-component system sensor histidine kinase CiaH
MKPFDKALLKLTAIFSAILLVVCVGFSAAIYTSAANGFERANFDRPPRPDWQMNIRDEVNMFVNERDERVKQELLMELIIINLVVLIGGLFASYYLARWTLKPINDNMESQKDFVSNASHELRAPLNIMKLENEILRKNKKATKSEYEKLVDSNLEEIDNLSNLCAQLLSLSRNEKFELAAVDVGSVSSKQITKIAAVAKQKNISVCNQITDQKITANQSALGEIILILLDNAVKYSPKNSTVTIKNDGHKILIIDEGLGIKDTDLPHIFERFYQADQSHSAKGYGLGLSLARHLAGQQGLKVSADKNQPTGSVFIIS